MKTLSNDADTGQPTINGQPATPEQVRELLLREDGYWWGGEYVTYEGGDARAELFFTDHKKSATVNRTQLEIIAGLYGAETEQWRGKRIELYGEFGTWFGKETWGIRVSNKIPPAPRNGRKVADADHEGVTDATPKQPGPIATEPTDYQD